VPWSRSGFCRVLAKVGGNLPPRWENVYYRGDAGESVPGLCFNSKVVPSPVTPDLRVRRAVPEDAPEIVAVMTEVVDARVHSAIDRAWTVEQERTYLEAVGAREAVHVALDGAHRVVGLQILERWSTALDSMAHVGQVGTFVLLPWRGRGVGRVLWHATATFAREAGYAKLLVQVRGTNAHAQSFYRRLGFAECGRLSRQVIIDGRYDDEILMELFL
jgi:ribosomal protein S18 acetylase RimI-like enzyme